MSHLKLATKLFINNEWVDAVSGKTFVVVDPATEQIIAHVAEGDKADVQKAVAAARAAFNPWRKMDPSQRGVLLNKFADLIEKNIDEFARIESVDAGKPLGQARSYDIPTSIGILRYFAGWCDKIHGKTLPVEPGLFAYTRREPIGVVAAIIPWNLPLCMAIAKLAPALATGNCIVLKPAEQAPLTPLKLGELLIEAGFPPGVVNIIPGFGPTAGAALAHHMDVDKISFTGSVEVGKIIQKASGESNLKRVTLELGGKSPLIVFNDADLDQAIEISHQAIFFNQGQACMAGSRLFVQEGIYDEFVKRVTERAKKRTVGAPTDPNAEQGPQIDAAQFNTVMKYIKAGKDQGAKLECGGQQVGTKGFFIQPTVFSGVKDDMTIAKEEIFGPVLSILKFSTLDEVIERANNTFYGLASGICTKDLSTAIKCADELRAGSVWINTYAAIKASTPFGGYKQSGIGREFGKYGLAAYSEVKSVVIKI